MRIHYLIRLHIIAICSMNSVVLSANSVKGFQENKGQFVNQNGVQNLQTKFLLQGNGMNFQLRNNGFSYDIIQTNQEPTLKNEPNFNRKNDLVEHGSIQFNRIDIEFLNANSDVKVVSTNPLDFYLNYYNDNGVFERVKCYERVVYEGVYDGVDIVFHVLDDGGMKYDIVVETGANLEQVKFKYSGQSSLKIENRKLFIKSRLTTISEDIPLSFYENTEGRTQANVRFKELGNNTIGFLLDSERRNDKLVIDPSPSLIWSGYFGGSSQDQGSSVCYTPDLDLILAGTTKSAGLATTGAHDEIYNPIDDDIFITRLDTERNVEWTTYYGGDLRDYIGGVHSDQNGDIVMGGSTFGFSNATTTGVYQSADPNASNVMSGLVVKFNPDGTRLWGTYFGGSSHAWISTLKINEVGDIFIGGSTGDNGSSIATPGAYNEVLGYVSGSYLARLSPSGQRIWGTFLWQKFGVSDFDIDENNIVVFGDDGSDEFRIYLAKFSQDGSFFWRNIFGGNGDSFAFGVTLEENDYIYVCGQTDSDDIATSGAFQETKSDTFGAFVQKFDSDGQFISGTFLNGNANEAAHDIHYECGKLVVIGTTESANFPITSDAIQLGNTPRDLFLTVITEDLDSLLYGTYFGGESQEQVNKGIGANLKYGGTELAVVFSTASQTAIANNVSPLTSHHGNEDAALMVIDLNVESSIITSENIEICEGESIELTANGTYDEYNWGGEWIF